MTSSIFLLTFFIGIVIVTTWLLITSKVTPEERDEMLNDEEMWP